MWRNKKVIIVLVLATVVVVAGIGGAVVANAQTDNTTSGNTLLARVAKILDIDQQKMEDAFAQARREAQEEGLGNHLKSLVEKGKITQDQADQYQSWWQSRPDVPLVGPGKKGPGIFRGHRGFPGMGGFSFCGPGTQTGNQTVY